MIIKCAGCEKKDRTGKFWHAPAGSWCNECYQKIIQPERSKREDFCLTKLADRYIEKWEPLPTEFATVEEAYIKGVYDFSDWLKQEMRCSEQSGNRLREVQ